MTRSGAWIAAAAASLLTGCAALPSLEHRTESVALTDTGATRLGRAIAPEAGARAGKSGIHPLSVPADAFAARVLLAHAAEKSLDVQYYIWRGDQTGYLLLEALWRAAERGVRVRLLLDDGGTSALDREVAVLDAHPNIEVRLYNPFVSRGSRAIGYLGDFARLNRRMHNKSFTADNQAAIVGGRNIGNEYFGAGGGTLFEDLDVIAIGPVVREVSKAFDLYWNSRSAYPAGDLIGRPADEARAGLETKFAAIHADPESIDYLEALRGTGLVRDLLDRKLKLEWVEARVLRDDPAKTLDTVGRRDHLLLADLVDNVARPESAFDLVSPYLVPGEEGTAALGALARRGVAVRILTNSLAATDVAAVHSGYAKRRRALLESGVRLYELKPTAAGAVPREKRKPGGSSSASLHAKTFAIDARRIFVGSFNFDPRSALLNTEMGLMIESPALARALADALDARLPQDAYEVRATADGLEWIERTAAGEVRQSSEPGAGLFKRAWIELLSVLPIDWLL